MPDSSPNPQSEIRNPQSPSPLPDRGHLLTEQRLGRSTDLDALSIVEALRVINEQDALIPAIVGGAIPQIARVVECVVESLRQGGRLIYIGAGTSGRLGVLDASEVPPTFHARPEQIVGIIAGGDAALRTSSEGREDEWDGTRGEFDRLHVGGHDTVIGIAAGGTTPYVLGGLVLARQRGATTALICCVAKEQLGGAPSASAAPSAAAALTPQQRHAVAAIQHLISLPVGAEVVTGSTRMKAGTATKLALNMITTAAMVQLGKVWGNLMVDMKASNDKLRDRAVRFIVGQTSLPRARALGLLDEAGGSVKLALVMAKRGVGAEEARELLRKADQKLRPILGPPA